MRNKMENKSLYQDFYYNELFKKYGLDFVKEKGYFDSKIFNSIELLDDTIDILSTPVNHLKKDNNGIILYTTGSYNPVHKGHIDMLIKAGKYLTNKGFKILGAYISPSHKNYVNSKKQHLYIHTNERIKLIIESIQHSPFPIHIDSWPSLFVNDDVNFTDCVTRLKKYIKKHKNLDIPVYYVVGEDKADFVYPFVMKDNEDGAIIITREGYSHNYEELKKYKNLHVITGNSPLSSTLIHQTPYIYKNKSLVVRFNDSILFEKQVLSLLYKYNNFINILKVSDQFNCLINIKNLTNLKIVSLDQIFNGDFHFEYSRVYNLFGYDFLYYKYDNKILEELINFTSNNKYILIDDDITTGSTIQSIMKLLPEESQKNLHHIHSFTTTNYNYTDVIDLRDFDFFQKESGLFIELPNNSIVRIPYIYPFIDPYIRCSLNNPIEFSKEIWNLNLNFYKSKKLSEFIGKEQLFLYFGFDLNQTFEQFANHFIKLLQQNESI
jgi:nicotinic acid mononucleotide adenylyltransferase